MSTLTFPPDFTFGVATSSYQVEGNIENDWSVWERAGHLKEPEARCGPACDHWNRFFEDIDLCRRTSLLGKNVMYLPSVRVQDREKRLSGNDALSVFTRKTTRIHLASAVKYFWKWSVFGSRLSS